MESRRTDDEPDLASEGIEERRPIRVLLAEDDHDVRIGLTRLLQFSGYEVRAVSNGADLLDVLTSWILSDQVDPPADIIVTDVRMPGFNGLNLVEGLRESGWKQPIIIISAFGDDLLLERVRRLGQDVEFMPKPFDPALLERTLVALTERQRRRGP